VSDGENIFILGDEIYKIYASSREYGRRGTEEKYLRAVRKCERKKPI
jgi:hypothetical protein